MAEEPLADGWGPSDPSDDTLLRAGVENVAARTRAMARALGRPIVDDGRWVAASLADEGMFSTAGVITRPPASWDWVPSALAELAPSGVMKLVMSPFPTPDLRGQGLHLIGHPPYLIRPAGGAAPPPAPGLEIRRIDDPSDLFAFESTLITGYPVPDMDPSKSPTLFHPAYLADDAAHLYLGAVNGEVVATAAAYVSTGVNQVEFVATLPSVRGRGIGAAMTWAATCSDPALPAVLISSDDGRGVYESLGYLPVCRWTLWLSH